ncbi:hypothetical protein TcasGA2_TC013438 [Tribolium castaneum]|uniref:Uncharacterized protein n=1 Tax=Tribolium castaneum TaxID=7070 RepID=D6WLI3_TRICA|nr:hypothetical protein TcasGA2_TC013438 [Tribolium castaneum]
MAILEYVQEHYKAVKARTSVRFYDMSWTFCGICRENYLGLLWCAEMGSVLERQTPRSAITSPVIHRIETPNRIRPTITKISPSSRRKPSQNPGFEPLVSPEAPNPSVPRRSPDWLGSPPKCEIFAFVVCPWRGGPRTITYRLLSLSGAPPPPPPRLAWRRMQISMAAAAATRRVTTRPASQSSAQVGRMSSSALRGAHTTKHNVEKSSDAAVIGENQNMLRRVRNKEKVGWNKCDWAVCRFEF